MKRTLLWVAVAMGVALWSAGAGAEVRLPALIGDNMVLQRDTVVKVWGWANPGEEVTVAADWPGQPAGKTVADDQGSWLVKLATAPAGGPYTLTISAGNTLTLKNILLGEVWVCSGQSNMQWTVSNSNNAADEIAQADWPQIRLFEVPLVFHNKLQDDVKGSWKVCSPQTVGSFSAAGYFFGRHLYQELKVPMGLIRSAWGGTVIEAWVSEEGLKPFPEFADRIDLIREADEAALRLAENKQKYNQNVPTMLYNAMIAPLLNYRIAGVIWYQGESNRGRPEQYLRLKQAWVSDWREKWQTGDFPFYWVQIAPYIYENVNGAGSGFLREAQMRALSIPNTGMAVTMDIGVEKDIHPKNKQDVGKRLALWALAKTYGRTDLVYSGPLYSHCRIDGGRIRLYFDHVAEGLAGKDGPLTDFTIAGADRQFVPAQATIEGDTIVVSSPQVAEPVAVRYAFTNWAKPNLFNSAGLPASSFRTDNWKE